MLSKVLLENPQPAIQRPIKKSFFVCQYLNDLLLVRRKLREDASEFRYDCRRKFSQETS